MHAGRPYGLHVVGKPLTEKDEAFISATALRFTNLKSVSNLDSLKLVYELPDGGSFVIQDAGGNFRVIAHKPIYQEQKYLDGLAKNYVPMLFCGAVSVYGLVKAGSGLRMSLTKKTQERVYNYDKNRSAPAGVELHRFVCEYNPIVSEFKPRIMAAGLTYTQYIKQRPTWYSGAMSEVMQIVGGYGKQEFDKLPDDDIERAQLIIPQKYLDRISDELSTTRLPAYSGVPNKDGQFQYDYKFLKTHIVSFDEQNNPWLVEVNGSGVWAMPLPIIPATQTLAFREYMKEVNDTEVSAILDRFGAMPSGESFPLGASAFQAWRRAGVIIKVCDTKDFYDHQAYSMAMGWSANTNGTELVNTCHNFESTKIAVTSFAYKIKLNLGAAKNNGRAKAPSSLTIDESARINRYLSALYDLIQENTAVNLAIKYKIHRVPIELLSSRARGKFYDSEVSYWNNLELEPIAKHEGNTVKIGQGYYFGGAEIKVPEPLFEGSLSIPLSLANRGDYPGAHDTIVLAYYVGDSLKTVRSFNDNRPHTREEDSNFEKYMYVGKWYEKILSGVAKLSGTIYLSDIDDRILTAPIEFETTVEGKDLGFGGADLQMDFYFWRTGTISRHRYYTTKTTKSTLYGKSISTALVLPFFCRNLVVYAKKESVVRREFEESLKLGLVKDPYTYRVWSDNETLIMFGRLEVQKGLPYPIDGQPVYAEIQNYNPNESNEWANNGPWVKALPSNVTSILYDYSTTIWAYEKTWPLPPVNEYKITKDEKPDSAFELKCQVFDRFELVNKSEHRNSYYSLSPDAFGNFFYLDACKVLFGSKRYANISELTEAGNRKQWGESALVDNKTAHHFIGVINE